MLVALVVLLAGLIGALGVLSAATVPAAGGGPARAAVGADRAAVDAFIRGYMRPDGRVVRTDQGGDTVSEGQAYAMLMTAAVGEPAPFARAWAWTAAHLQEPDGLLAWHWSGGAVVDGQPATDGDLGATAALVMAARRFSDPVYLAAGRRIAAAVAAHETVNGPSGTTLLAGPWARSGRYVDPSYLSFAEIHQMVTAFGGLWTGVARTAAHQLEGLDAGGRLPPDWAVTTSKGSLRPTGPPGSSGAKPRYGFDAVRAPIWMASACNAGLRGAAASLLPVLHGAHGTVDLDLHGRPAPGTSAPVGLLAEAAAEMAAGNQVGAGQLTGRAQRENAVHPTYYGTAWVALAMLGFDHTLEPCA